MRRSISSMGTLSATSLIFLTLCSFSSSNYNYGGDEGQFQMRHRRSADSNEDNSGENSQFPSIPSVLAENAQSSKKTHVVFVNHNKQEATLTCDDIPVSQDDVTWFRRLPKAKSFTDISDEGGCLSRTMGECDDDKKSKGHGKDEDEDDDDDDNDDEKGNLVCKKSKSHFNNSDASDLYHSTLKLSCVHIKTFELFECRQRHTQRVIRRFLVINAINPTRRSKEKKKETDIKLTEGEHVHLYCNYTRSKKVTLKQLPFLKVTWRIREEGSENWTDITQDLSKKRGDFKNFTRVAPNEFDGPVSLSHRAWYQCSVEFDEVSGSKDNVVVDPKSLPREFEFFVRVQGPYRWVRPTIILIVEIIAMAVFTICVWRREEASKKQTGDDGVMADEDSDDEDQVTPPEPNNKTPPSPT